MPGRDYCGRYVTSALHDAGSPVAFVETALESAQGVTIDLNQQTATIATEQQGAICAQAIGELPTTFPAEVRESPLAVRQTMLGSINVTLGEANPKGLPRADPRHEVTPIVDQPDGPQEQGTAEPKTARGPARATRSRAPRAGLLPLRSPRKVRHRRVVYDQRANRREIGAAVRPLAAHITALLLAGLAIFGLTEAAAAAVTPPFGGTVWIGSSVLTPLSATDLLTVTPAGMGVRMTYDRRSGWVTQTAYLFNSTFTGTGTVEAIVNAEFGSVAAAQSEAERYSRVVGQLPRACRLNVDALWIHRGSDAFGGGNRSLLIHTDYAQANWSFIEELLIHECAHTSLDSSFGGTVSAAAWARAADADPGFISTYAETNPLREDVAESFLPYLAWRLGAASGYTASQLAEIHAQIANRIDYFDSLRLNLNPVIATPSPTTPAGPAETPSPDGAPPAAAALQTLRP